MEPGSLASIVCNALIVIFCIAAICGHGKKAPLKVLLRYFTVLSNLLCAVAALAVVICRLGGALPDAVRWLKYAGTASVTVTFLTVIAFLGPTLGYKLMLTGPDLWLHLICPLLALLSYFAWDRPDAPFAVVLLALLPVLLYGVLYIYRVLYAPEERRWKDFYGFNRGGKWPLSYAAMAVAAFLIGLALWAI